MALGGVHFSVRGFEVCCSAKLKARTYLQTQDQNKTG
jgi:hypothetical protein